MFRARFTRILGAAVVLVALGGCGSFWSIADTDGTLEDTVRTYAKLVRWGELEHASLFVDEELRADFIALAPGLSKLHFTDYDLGPVEQTPGEARVTAVYRFFDPNTLVERQVRLPQVWSSTTPNVWVVRPDLSGLQAVVFKPGREPAG